MKVKSEQRGISLIEAALVLPVVILIVLGLIDFGRIQALRYVYQRALYATARQAAIITTSCTTDDNQLRQYFAEVVAGYALNRAPSQLSSAINAQVIDPGSTEGIWMVTVTVVLPISCYFCPLVAIDGSFFDFNGARSSILEDQLQCP